MKAILLVSTVLFSFTAMAAEESLPTTRLADAAETTCSEMTATAKCDNPCDPKARKEGTGTFCPSETFVPSSTTETKVK